MSSARALDGCLVDRSLGTAVTGQRPERGAPEKPEMYSLLLNCQCYSLVMPRSDPLSGSQRADVGTSKNLY